MAVLVLGNFIAWMGLYVLRNSDVYKPSYMIRNISKEIPFDYIIVGSSTGLTGLNTNVIDSIAKTNGFNISLDGVGPAGQYMMLQHFFKNGFKTRKVILSLDNHTVRDSSIEQSNLNEYYFIPWISKDYIYACFVKKDGKLLKTNAYTKYCPLLGFSYYNQQFLGSILWALKDSRQRYHFDAKGNKFYNFGHFRPDKDGVKYFSDTLSVLNPYIRKMEKLCCEQGVQLIYFLHPEWQRDAVVTDSVNYLVLNFRNFFNNSPEYFYDNIHVNVNGQYLLSEKVGSMFLNDPLK